MEEEVGIEKNLTSVKINVLVSLFNALKKYCKSLRFIILLLVIVFIICLVYFLQDGIEILYLIPFLVIFGTFILEGIIYTTIHIFKLKKLFSSVSIYQTFIKTSDEKNILYSEMKRIFYDGKKDCFCFIINGDCIELDRKCLKQETYDFLISLEK